MLLADLSVLVALTTLQAGFLHVLSSQSVKAFLMIV
jgi:hypothetical protein